MIDWETVEKALVDWWEKQTRLQCDRLHGQQPHRRPVYSHYQITSSRSRGDDITKCEFDATQPAGREAVTAQWGHREFTVSYTVTSRSHQPNESAHYYLERARTGLKKPSTLQLLAAAGVAVVRTHPLVVVDRAADNRVESVGKMDIDFAATAWDLDAAEQGAVIETVVVSSDVQDIDGSSVGDSLQLDEESLQ